MKEKKGNEKNKKTKTTPSKAKSYTPKEKGELKLRKGFLISIAVILIMTLITYFLAGIEFAIITAIGVTIILIFARLLDSKRNKKKQRKIAKVFLIIFLVFAIIGVLGVGGFLIYVVTTAPEFNEDQLKEKPSTILYDSDGKEFAKLGSQLRENIEFDDLPEVFVDALIATEDSRFFQHNGLDLARFSKAAVGQLLGKDDAGGGSTLSMQVIKINFTDDVATGIKGLIRKFTDIYLAVFKLEKNYTKEQIIEFYINNNNLGGAWGVEAASKYYFNKSASELNLAEASLLAGMYKAPEYYNPYRNPEATATRRKTVLNLMVRHGYITREEADMADSIPIESLLTQTTSNQNSYQGYIDTLCEEIQKKYGLNPRTTSMLVYTNMNRKKQDALNDVANGKTYKWINDYVQAGIVVVDSGTGKVEALIPGRNQANIIDGFNYATDLNVQIGSTAKPLFDYGPGIEYNNWSTYTLFDDSPTTYANGQSIRNYDSSYKGLITLRYALSDSRNVPALKAFRQVDKKKVIELVTSVGITPEISGNTLHEAHAIGSFNGSNPMQMAGAYQIFSNGGKYTEPYLASKIVLRLSGEEINADVETKQVISDSTSYMIADVLKGVVTNRMRNFKYHITDNFSVKSGTTNYPSNYWDIHKGLAWDAIPSAWIIGFTTKTVVSIWYGYEKLDPEHLDRVLHWNPAIQQRENLFNAVANAVFNHDGSDFVMPSSVVKVGVEAGTNPPKLPSANTPSNKIVYELFKKGTEPTEISNSYSQLAAPTNLSVNYQNNQVTLSWNGVRDEGYVDGGTLGYYIYFDGKQIAFTTNTSYVINNLSSYLGTYSVKAGYKDTTTSMSKAATKTLGSTASYKLSIRDSNTTYINVGEGIDKTLYDGSLVVLTENGQAISNVRAYLSITITNSSGDVVTSISSENPDTYTITYTVNYNGFSDTVSNKITIR